MPTWSGISHVFVKCTLLIGVLEEELIPSSVMPPSLTARKTRQAIMLGRAKVGTENIPLKMPGMFGEKTKAHITIDRMTVALMRRQDTSKHAKRELTSNRSVHLGEDPLTAKEVLGPSERTSCGC